MQDERQEIIELDSFIERERERESTPKFVSYTRIRFDSNRGMNSSSGQLRQTNAARVNEKRCSGNYNPTKERRKTVLR